MGAPMPKPAARPRTCSDCSTPAVVGKARCAPCAKRKRERQNAANKRKRDERLDQLERDPQPKRLR